MLREIDALLFGEFSDTPFDTGEEEIPLDEPHVRMLGFLMLNDGVHVDDARVAPINPFLTVFARDYDLEQGLRFPVVLGLPRLEGAVQFTPWVGVIGLGFAHVCAVDWI